MIKIYGDTFYMTMGEACYIARGVEHVAFGARIEPEDDAECLGGAAARGYSEIEDDDISLFRGGEKIAPRFVATGAKVKQKLPIGVLPVLRGESELEITLRDGYAGLELKLYYTPYVRGGIARRAVLTNLSGGEITVERLLCGVPTGGGEVQKCADGLISVVSASGAYGAFTLYAGETDLVVTDGRVACGAKTTAVLSAGESFYTPETLFAYSDRGVGGLVRAYHDILREFAMPSKKVGKRMTVAVYCPTDGDGEKTEERASAAAALGADTVVVDGECDSDVLKECGATIKRHGMTFGLKLPFDCADAQDRVSCAGADTVEIDCRGLKTYGQAASAFALYKSLCEKFPEADIEFLHSRTATDAKAALKQISRSPVPPCFVRTLVKTGKTPLKTAFDVAAFGALGYAFDPCSLNDGVRRAVRAQILSYRDDAETIKTGDVYDIGDGVMSVGKDKSRAIAVAFGDVTFVGLDAHNLYHVRESGKTFSGAALAYYGFSSAGDGTVTYHIRQVADYE